jgi:hypothetical protein
VGRIHGNSREEYGRIVEYGGVAMARKLCMTIVAVGGIPRE